jgi:hypothetical protein
MGQIGSKKDLPFSRLEAKIPKQADLNNCSSEDEIPKFVGAVEVDSDDDEDECGLSEVEKRYQNKA